MKKKYVHGISVIRRTNSFILKVDIFCILRYYSKDDFSNLPGKAQI